MPDGPHAPPGDCLARCSGDTTATLDTEIIPGAVQRRLLYGPRASRVLPRQSDSEPRGAVCSERYGGGAIRRRCADPYPPGGHLAHRRLLYRCGRIRTPGRNDWSLSAQRPWSPDRGALAVAAVEA